MLPGSALRTQLARLSVNGLSGIAFRLIYAKYAGSALSSIGSLHFGGRFNAPGAFEALKAPSARDRYAFNLVVFPDRLGGGSAVRVYDDSGIIDAHLP